MSANYGKASSTLILLLLILLTGGAVVVVEARRMCHTFLQCAPLLLSAPISEIVDASKYYAKSFLVVSEINDQEWQRQMILVEDLCQTWVTFDTCMERNWIECVDWEQMLNFLDVMARRVEQVGVAGAQVNKEAANHAKEAFRNNKWTVQTLRDAMDVVSFSCQNIKRITPYMKCAKDVMMANETILNVTMRWRALAEVQCFDGTRLDCDKTQTMMTLLGHWMYHGCRNMTEELTDIVRMIFTTVFGQQMRPCVHLIEGKTTQELFEKPPPPEVYLNFGDDLTHCNMTAVATWTKWTYDGTITDYLVAHNITKKQFFEMMQRRLKKDTGDTVDATEVITSPSTTETPPPQIITVIETTEETTTKRVTARYGKRRRRTTTPPNDDYGNNGADDHSSSTACHHHHPIINYYLLPIIIIARIL